MPEKPVQPLDVVLIGGGIMSATLGALIHRLEPDWSIRIYERLADVAEESSNPWNNAGTGHSALCELNYTPELPDGSVDISKAIGVNEQFQVSRQFWAHLVETGALAAPETFINPTPHISFVWGEDNVSYMRTRYEAMKDHPLFAGLEYSDNARQIRRWAPALIPGRKRSQPIAATYSPAGSDVDFGSLTRQLVDGLRRDGVQFESNHVVKNVSRRKDGTWELLVKNEVGQSRSRIAAKFVFVGAGGGALQLLQRSGIPEIRGYGGFPVSGEFLRSDDPAVVVKHAAKVYGKASVGAPPMSVPHLDTRIVDGQASLMFGPYAGFSPKFLKQGSWSDLFRSIRLHNLRPMLSVAFSNMDLVRYLVGQLLASRSRKFAALRDFMPSAQPGTGTGSRRDSASRSSSPTASEAVSCSSAPRSSPRRTAASPGCSAPRPGRRPRCRSCSGCSSAASPTAGTAGRMPSGGWCRRTASGCRTTRRSLTRRSPGPRRRCTSTADRRRLTSVRTRVRMGACGGTARRSMPRTTRCSPGSRRTAGSSGA